MGTERCTTCGYLPDDEIRQAAMRAVGGMDYIAKSLRDGSVTKTFVADELDRIAGNVLKAAEHTEGKG
jgi:hypothetical protein